MIPIFELKLNDQFDGITFVSLVDYPAIERNFMAFNQNFVEPQEGESEQEFVSRCIAKHIEEGKEQEQASAICHEVWRNRMGQQFKFTTTNKEQRIITGPVMLANYPIYRNDPEKGEHYVVFRPETIKELVLKFFRQGNQNRVNTMHLLPVEDVFMFESWLVDTKAGKIPPEGFEGISDGSWFGSFKVDNDEIWNNYIKTGKFKGFSVEGIFSYSAEKTAEEQLIYDIINIINEID